MIKLWMSSFLLVPLGACATVPYTQSTLLDEKALYASELLYNTSATTYLEAVDSGTLTGEAKEKAKLKLLSAYKHLAALRVAHKLGDRASFNSALVLFNQALK